MEIIRERDIDFHSLKKFKCKTNSESNLFYDDNFLYKIYRRSMLGVAERKEKKIKILNDGNKLDNVIIPDKMILRRNFMSGCGMDYINNATVLFDFSTKNRSIDDFFKMIFEISLSLRKIHNDPRNIVIGDLSFSNIIFDENMRHYFIDFDSCMVGKLQADMISFLLYDYNKERSYFGYNVDCNTDRLCLVLNTLYTIFHKNIDELTMDEFDEKAEKVMVLRGMRELVLEIKRKMKIAEVPYIDEFIPKKEIKVKQIVKSILV